MILRDFCKFCLDILVEYLKKVESLSLNIYTKIFSKNCILSGFLIQNCPEYNSIGHSW